MRLRFSAFIWLILSAFMQESDPSQRLNQAGTSDTLGSSLIADRACELGAFANYRHV